MTHHINNNEHYRPSIFYLSLYLLIIILSELIFSRAFHNPIPIPIKKPVSAWKTYTSAKHSLTFEHPSGWQIVEGNSEIDLIEPGSKFGFVIQIIKNATNLENIFRNWEKSPVYKINSDSQAQIGNLKTIELIDNTGNTDHNQYSLYAVHEKDLIAVTYLTDNPTRTTAISKILSSVNFLETQSPTPIIINTRTVKLYNKSTNSESCESDTFTEAQIPVTQTPITDTIKLLIKDWHKDFYLKGAKLNNGILTLEFPTVYSFTTGGSCNIISLTSSIINTAKQFPEVKEVVIDPQVFQP